MSPKSKELADASIKAFGDFVDRKLAPTVANVGEIAQRLEALERRLAALERKQGGEKARPVSLLKADDR